MRVLVTGGSGFIGSHLVDRLANAYEVLVVDPAEMNFRNNKAAYLKCSISNFIANTDIMNIDYIVHCAANSSVINSLENPVQDAMTNIVESVKLIEFAKIQKDLKKFIYLSTGGAYYGNKMRAKETDSFTATSPYSLSKYLPEGYLSISNLNYISLRLSNIYGPRQNPKGEAGVVAIFINKMLNNESPTIYGTGEQLRDFLYVDDAINAILLAMKSDQVGPFNISSGLGTSVSNIYDMIGSIIKFEDAPEFASERKEIKKITLDFEKARQKLDWNPATQISEGLKKTVQWFQENRKD